MKIVFPEYQNPEIQKAIKSCDIEAIPAENLETACEILNRNEADGMIAGIDYTTRDVILACKNFLGAQGKTFTASMYFTKPNAQSYLVADIAACRTVDEERLYDICLQTYASAKKLFQEPKMAILSFSTKGSGGDKDETILRAQKVVEKIKAEHPEILIDGEMQLDCAIDPRVAQKKAPNSAVAGQANVLICPDLNTGNILYKALEYFGGYTAAGPLLQGFNKPVSDLSRGSTAEDIKLTIETLEKLNG